MPSDHRLTRASRLPGPKKTLYMLVGPGAEKTLEDSIYMLVDPHDSTTNHEETPDTERLQPRSLLSGTTGRKEKDTAFTEEATSMGGEAQPRK